MIELFLRIFNMSVAASYLVLAVVLLRLVLKRSPKWVTVALWGLVAIRLLCPFTVESALSLIPSAETVSPNILTQSSPTINSGIHAFNSTVNPVIGQLAPPVSTPAQPNPLEIFLTAVSILWVVGIALMVLYSLISYWRLRHRVATAVRLRDNILRSEFVASPFVLGFFRPKIYLGNALDTIAQDYVIAHERAHIRRRDHWWKPLGFLLLSIHWFNPLMWLSYILLCRDIELACDEKVIRELGTEARADYSQALLDCSIRRGTIAACPLAFGEVGVKERVKKVLNYKKPAFWMIVLAITACIVVAVCFLTNPPKDDIAAGPVEVWFDRSQDIALSGERRLDAFPGVTFKWNYEAGSLIAVKDGAETVLFPYGFVSSVYVADVTGDGNPDFCANVYTFFSGFSSFNAVHVYDYANDRTYVLNEANPQDHYHNTSYYVYLEDGKLICEKEHVATGKIITRGLLGFQDDSLYLIDPVNYESPIVYEKAVRDEYYRGYTRLVTNPNGTCSIVFSSASSSSTAGTYTQTETHLTVQTEDGRTYIFRFSSDGIIFQASGSSPLPKDSLLEEGMLLPGDPYWTHEESD